MKEHVGFIYLFTNMIDGKKYVGQTKAKKAEHRWNAHRRGSKSGAKTYVHRAIARDGWENFEKKIIWVGCIALLNDKETQYIDKHNSFVDGGHGYNLTRGGGVESKSRRVIAKHKKAAKRRWEDPEERAKQSERKKANWLDPAYREAATLAQTGKTLSKRTCRKISAAKLGKKASEATRATMSVTHRQRYVDEPTLRFRVGAGNRGNHTPKSEVAKQNMRISAAKRWARPEEHVKASTAQRGRKGKPHSEESRAARSAKTKSLWQNEEYRAAHSTISTAVAASNKRRALERKLASG